MIDVRVISLSSLSLAGGSGIAEAKIVLWSADGTTVNATTSSQTSYDAIGDGSNAVISISATNAKLFTLSSTWNSSMQFALEVSAYVSSGTTGWVTLYDSTTSTFLTSNQITVTSTTESVIRSGKFTLTPNHSYVVALSTSNASYLYISDASLIIFPS